MLSRLGYLIVALIVTLPVRAAEKSGSISGYVRSASGVPQMGAMVEVLSSAVRTFRVFTDEKGFYSAKGLVPGSYTVKVSAPSFLPIFRERVGIRSGGMVVLNLTLSTLFDAINIAPLRGASEDDDWKWVLRSASNRPILRVLDEDPSQLSAESKNNKEGPLKGTLSFLAGSAAEGYGSTSDVSTAFTVEKSIFSSGVLAVRGNVGYGSSSPAMVVRTSYTSKGPGGSGPELALTMRRLAAPDVNLRNATLLALSLSAADDLVLNDILELRFGSELQTIQFMGRVTALRPFAKADLHLSPDTVLEYSYTSSQPDQRLEKGFESAPADLSESGPHMSLANSSSYLESAHHHEVSLSRRIGNSAVQLAAYSDRVANPALTGVGEVSTSTGEVLPDLYSGTFTYQGRQLETHGMRMVVQHKIAPGFTASLDYGYGGVLDLGKEEATLQDARQWMEVRNRHSVAGKLSGVIPTTKTRWIASYRWTGGRALTPVDMFDASPGQSEPFLNIFLRQPIPGTGFLPGHMDALIDMRNLLAQGYVPVMGQDGRTVYLVQSARTVRGGVAFTF